MTALIIGRSPGGASYQSAGKVLTGAPIVIDLERNLLLSTEAPDRHYLYSGMLTSTLKTFQDVGTVNRSPRGITWDETNTIWAGIGSGAGHTRSFFLSSGVFSSTIKLSQQVEIAWDPALNPVSAQVQYGVSWDGSDLISCGGGDEFGPGTALWKLYRSSGQFGSAPSGEEDITSLGIPVGVCWDGSNTSFVISGATDRLYLSSGKFTSTIKDSLGVSATNTAPIGISFDYVNGNALYSGASPDRIYVLSGQFSSTIISTLSISNPLGQVRNIEATRYRY